MTGVISFPLWQPFCECGRYIYVSEFYMHVHSRFFLCFCCWWHFSVSTSIVTLTLLIKYPYFCRINSYQLSNQLPASVCHRRTNLSSSDSPSPASGTSPTGSIDWPFSLSIAPSLFHSMLKTSFLQILPTVAFLFFFRTDSTDSRTVYRHLWAYPFFTFLFCPLFKSCWLRAID